MKQVRCKNKRLDNEGSQHRCNRLLMCLPEWVFDGLKEREGKEDGKVIARCTSCKVSRFSEIKYVDGKLTFVSIKNPDIEKIENVFFDSMVITEEVGGF